MRRAHVAPPELSRLAQYVQCNAFQRAAADRTLDQNPAITHCPEIPWASTSNGDIMKILRKTFIALGLLGFVGGALAQTGHVAG